MFHVKHRIGNEEHFMLKITLTVTATDAQEVGAQAIVDELGRRLEDIGGRVYVTLEEPTPGRFADVTVSDVTYVSVESVEDATDDSMAPAGE